MDSAKKFTLQMRVFLVEIRIIQFRRGDGLSGAATGLERSVK